MLPLMHIVRHERRPDFFGPRRARKIVKVFRHTVSRHDSRMENEATGTEGAHVKRKGIRFATTVVVLLLSAPAAFGQPRDRVPPSLEDTAQSAGAAVVEIFATSYVPRPGLVPRTADLVTTQRASGSGV